MALFGLREPMGPFSDPQTAPMQNIVPSQPSEPFVFGRGGQRISQDDIALRRRVAAQQMAGATDTSPVGHWTAGLARALGGLTGGLEMRRLDRASAENQEATSAAIAAALAPGGTLEGGGDPIAALLANPETQGLGAQLLKARTPKEPDISIQRANNGDIMGIDTATGRVVYTMADPNPKPVIDWQRSVDPLTGEVTLTPFGPNGPMGGVSGAPDTLPPDFDFGEGGGVGNGTGGFPR